MCRAPLDAIPMVDSAFARLMVDVKVLQVVVKVHGTSAEISAEQRCMSGENSSDVDMTLATKRDSKASLPFVEVCHDSRRELS